MQGVEELLTDEAKQAKLRELMGVRQKLKGDIFVPDLAFYDLLQTDHGLTQAAIELYKWVGIKPYRLKVQYSNSEPAAPSHATHALIVPAKYQPFPYLAGAYLTLLIIDQIIRKQLGYQNASTGFIEYASIHWGLGLPVLNGIAYESSLREKIHHIIAVTWHHETTIRLHDYRMEDYAKAISAHVHDHRLTRWTWAEFVQKDAQKLLWDDDQHVIPAIPSLERVHIRRRRSREIRLTLIAIAFALTVCIAIFTWAQRPIKPSKETVDLYQTIQTIGIAHQACMSAAKQQRTDLDLNDMFMERQLEATLSRCKSLENQYNYQVDAYNRLVSQ